MADIKISALPTATTPLTGAELVPVVQGGVTKQTTTSDVLAAPVTSLTASSAVATDASKKLVSVANTGTGDNVLATSPTLVTPILGTPTSATLTNATGLPIASGVSGLGTGVATALAVNVGTAGAPVVNGGALGTPSSGTVTNLTGTANITATGGASGAIAATTLSASSTVSGTGFSSYLASPPAIGGTAAAAVSATALSYTTTLTGGTGIVNLGSGQFYKDTSGNVGVGKTPVAGRGLLQVNGDAEVTSLNTGQLAGLRNKIINGNMDVWQRGASFTINNTSVYTSDRIKFESSGVGNTTVSQVTVTAGSQASINTGARYVLSATGVAGLSYFILSQPIEYVNTFESKIITCSIYCTQPATATSSAYFRAAQVFGTGGSATVNTDVNVTSTAVGSHYRWTATITIPSISGKTIGTANDYLWINLVYVPTTFTTNFQFYGLQAELGSVATPFEQRPYGMELALCQRYLPVLTSGTYSSGYCISTTQAYVMPSLQVYPRVAPTGITTTVSGNLYSGTTGIALTGITYIGSSSNTVILTATVASGLTSGNGTMLYTANPIFLTGCEL